MYVILGNLVSGKFEFLKVTYRAVVVYTVTIAKSVVWTWGRIQTY